MKSAAASKKTSLLDDILLPPRAAPTPPAEKDDVVARMDIDPLAIQDQEAKIVMAPYSIEELRATCSGALWPMASATYGEIFTVTRTLPYTAVIQHLKEKPEFKTLVENKFSDEEALSQMGFRVVPVQDSVSFGGLQSGTRLATVSLYGEKVKVEVDAKKGPVGEGVSELMGYCGANEGVRWHGNKTWSQMTSTEREVWLVTVARHKQNFELLKKAKLEEAKQTEFWAVRRWSAERKGRR
mmetsp:Transcript_76338/g.223842  ORF Transcript_76338/g.223842 Transcript_76338/m.223842 type:complete len:240 (+) Transcript_76338:53-772(+)